MWQNVGDNDDVVIREVRTEVIEIDSDDEDAFKAPSNPLSSSNTVRPRPSLSQDERQRAIKQEIFGDYDLDGDSNGMPDDDDDIILIDDEFDDTLAEVASNADVDLDTSVVDDMFGTDTLLADFANINDAMPDQTTGEQIITCPICTERMSRDNLAEHFDGCQGVRRSVVAPRSQNSRMVTPPSHQAKRARWSPSTTAPRRSTMVRTPQPPRLESNIGNPVPSTSSTSSSAGTAATEKVQCPSCWRQLPLEEMNAHLDLCLC